VLCYEGLNGPVALMAALAELCEQFRRDASDLETGISASCVPLILNLIAESFNLTRQRIAVDFREIGPAFIDVRCLQRLPAALRAIERQVSGNRVRVDLRIKFAAGVMVVDRKHQVAGSSVLIRAGLPDPARRVRLDLL
jgi:hypothetical protein